VLHPGDVEVVGMDFGWPESQRSVAENSFPVLPDSPLRSVSKSGFANKIESDGDVVSFRQMFEFRERSCESWSFTAYTESQVEVV